MFLISFSKYCQAQLKLSAKALNKVLGQVPPTTQTDKLLSHAKPVETDPDATQPYEGPIFGSDYEEEESGSETEVDDFDEDEDLSNTERQ